MERPKLNDYYVVDGLNKIGRAFEKQRELINYCCALEDYANHLESKLMIEKINQQ